jgi:hypothetical protein
VDLVDQADKMEMLGAMAGVAFMAAAAALMVITQSAQLAGALEVGVAFVLFMAAQVKITPLIQRHNYDYL